MEPQISCRGLSAVLDICESRGIDFSHLADGLDLDMATLRNPRRSIPWKSGAVVIERLAEAVGGIEAYGQLVAAFVDDPKAVVVRKFLRMGLTPAQNFSLVFRWVGPMTFPFMSSKVNQLDKSTFLVELRIPEELPGSLPFTSSAVNLARALPRIHGLPEALVEASMSDRHCDMRVTLPSISARFQRAKAWFSMMQDAPSVVEELIEHQLDLQSTNTALQQALLDAQKREDQLAREIAAKKEAQTQLAASNEQLLQAQRLDSLGRLAGGVAHDFNNVLTAVFGNAELLRRIHNDPNSVQAINEILGAGQRAAALTRRLLTFAKQGEVAARVIDAGTQLGQMRDLLCGLLPGQALKLKLPDEPLAILADPVQLEQVIINLVVNARDAMPDGGKVSIELRSAERENAMWARIDVLDTGVGMDGELTDRIFDPFFTTKGDLGTGLGLATTYGIVSEAGGHIEVESTVGTGSRFSIWWPLHTGPHEALRESEAKNEGRLQASGHVLIIEDELVIRNLIAQTLTSLGLSVSCSSDAASAMAAADAAPTIDMVVSDVMLKSERGPAIVDVLRKTRPALPVLFISGHSQDQQILVAGSRFLQKPFTMEALGREVCQIMSAAKGN